MLQVVAAGFTIAPLQKQYVRDGAVQECLVTMVLKLDLGGWLAEGATLSFVARPLVHAMRDAFVEPMLMALISLRDQVCGKLCTPPHDCSSSFPSIFGITACGSDLLREQLCTGFWSTYMT
jgi:hypothetical protein